MFFGTINQELLDEIVKIQKAIRNYDILEEMQKQIGQKLQNKNIKYYYTNNELLEQIPIDLNNFKYIKPFPPSNISYFKNLNIETFIKKFQKQRILINL